MALRIIYINTTGHMSGAAVSMREVIQTLSSSIRPLLLTPRGSATAFLRGTIEEIFEVPWLAQFDHTRHGRYRGARWLIALRELLLLPVTVFGVWHFSRKVKCADLIHLNEITGIIPAVVLKRFIDAPLVVHVRANMGDQSRGLRSSFLWYLIRRHAVQVICIDETVRGSVPRDIQTRVIHNSLDIKHLRNNSMPADRSLGGTSRSHAINVGIVGSIIRVKGVHEFVDAAISICGKRQDVRFYMVGAGLRRLRGLKAMIFSKLGLAEDAEALIAHRIAASGMTGRITMTGHISDLVAVYENLDILCFPSHYDAPGRPIFEAALFGKPSIVAIERPLPDTLVDGVTGIAIRARDSNALEAAIVKLVDSPLLRRNMGEAARTLARGACDPGQNAAQVADVYRAAVARWRSDRGIANHDLVPRVPP